MKIAVCLMVVPVFAAAASADVLYSHPPQSPASLIMSSEAVPEGSDWDEFAWDSFILPGGGSITEVVWRGGYIRNAPYGRANGFAVAFHASTAANSEPYVLAYLKRYHVSGNAGETFVGNANGINIYEYRVTLAQPFVAAPGVKYWVQIEGEQPGTPDWGWQAGQGGNGSHFQYLHGQNRYLFYPKDCAFTLSGAGPCYADCDPSTGQGVLDIFDFLCFQNRYAAGDPYACGCDVSTGQAVCDIFDFLCFQNSFAAGCP